jgi:hypothetical protein
MTHHPWGRRRRLDSPARPQQPVSPIRHLFLAIRHLFTPIRHLFLAIREREDLEMSLTGSDEGFKSPLAEGDPRRGVHNT